MIMGLSVPNGSDLTRGQRSEASQAEQPANADKRGLPTG